MAADHPREPRRRARRRALQALYQWRFNPGPAEDIIRQFIKAQDFDRVDVDWFESQVKGVISTTEELDGALEPYFERSAGNVDVMERLVLRMGAWELLNHPEIPFQITVSEAVDLARRFGSEQGHEFVNAVLDRAARDWRGAPGGGPGEIESASGD